MGNPSPLASVSASGDVLIALDDCPMLSLDTRHPSVELPFDVLAVSADDELGRTSALQMRLGASADKVVGQVVEGGTEVGEGVADDEIPFGWKGSNAVNGEPEMIRRCMELFANPINWFGLAVAPRPYVSLEFVHVFLCPIKLVPATFVENTHNTGE
jgi:hypothetical protein